MATAPLMPMHVECRLTEPDVMKQETATGLRTAARAGATLVLLTFAEFVRIGLPPENDGTIRSPYQSIPTSTFFVSTISGICKILQQLCL
jgi:hypothetical protein